MDSDASSREHARRWMRQFATNLFTVLFPSDCRICGESLTEISRLPVCQDCLDAMNPIQGNVCAICGERLFSPYMVVGPQGDYRCGLCRRTDPVFAKAVAYGSYESGLRELIHLLKFGSVRPAANVLGRMLAEMISGLDSEFPTDGVVVIPVPLHRTKFRQRGFNQAELIATAAIKITKAEDRLHLSPGILVRRRETSSQIGLTSHQRRENVRGAFGVAQPEVVKDREVLLVDDVFTTGATVSECARVLRRAGATKVWVATVARTLKNSSRSVEIRLGDFGEKTGEVSGVEEIPLARAVGG